MKAIKEIFKRLLEQDGDDFDPKEVAYEPPPEHDFHVSFEGTLCLVEPLNERAKKWLQATAPEDAQFYGGAMVVEVRYIRGVVAAFEDDGLTANVRTSSQEESLVTEDEEGGEGGEGDDTIKDILGADYMEPSEPEEEGNVIRHDRWANVIMGDWDFCISYLTPVAYYEPGVGVTISNCTWSVSTVRHIKKWMDEIGFDYAVGGSHSWKNVEGHFQRMPQMELIDLFRKKARNVRWTNRQARTLAAVPRGKIRYGLRSGSDYHVSINPHCVTENEEEEEEEDFSTKEVEWDPGETAGPATVKRYGRMKIVDMPGYTFLISYLTPVAYLNKELGVYYRTTKQWSATTNSHISRWQAMIDRTPEWKNNPANRARREPMPGETEGREYVPYPHFHGKRQNEISALFRQLMKSMQMPAGQKRRLYHVAPEMRAGTAAAERARTWSSGHCKHHNSRGQGLPRPHEASQDAEYKEFFKDFSPDEAEMWDWQQSGRRSQEPHEPGE